MLRRFRKDRKGATAVEYSLIIAVLSLVIVAGISTATNAVLFLFTDTSSKLVQHWNAND